MIIGNVHQFIVLCLISLDLCNAIVNVDLILGVYYTSPQSFIITLTLGTLVNLDWFVYKVECPN